MHQKVEFIIRKVLHFLEGAIAVLTLIVLVGFLCKELYGLYTVFILQNADITVHDYLHEILTIVVGLEFVKMLIDMTPANTLEVLIVAIARQVIVSHDNPLSNLACVACIAGLFAIRHFLIPKAELTLEMSEVEEEAEKETV